MQLRKIIVVVSIIVILGGAFLIMGLLSGMKEQPAQRDGNEIKKLVRVREVNYQHLPASIIASGRLGSNQIIDIIAEVQGDIRAGEIPLKKGQNFRKGDLMVRIDERKAEFTLKASKSKFINLIANALPDFKIDYPERYDDLLNFYESIRIEQPLPEMPEIKSPSIRTFLASKNILNEYYSIKAMEVDFERYFIYATFNGSYLDVMMEVGSIANPGSRIARIIHTDLLELEVPVEADNIKWINIGDEILVALEDESREWKGKVARISNFVSPTTQSASVFISIDASGANKLYEGQYLKAFFRGSMVADAMEIPRSAVYNFDEVYVVNDGVLRKKTMNVLKVNQETIIFNGLEEGLLVVIDPLANVTEGTAVEVAIE